MRGLLLIDLPRGRRGRRTGSGARRGSERRESDRCRPRPPRGDGGVSDCEVAGIGRPDRAARVEEQPGEQGPLRWAASAARPQLRFRRRAEPPPARVRQVLSRMARPAPIPAAHRRRNAPIVRAHWWAPIAGAHRLGSGHPSWAPTGERRRASQAAATIGGSGGLSGHSERSEEIDPGDEVTDGQTAHFRQKDFE
jgi:hypothetical protein